MKLHSVVTSAQAKVKNLTTVLIHGLDSSSQTWTKNTLTALPTRCIAMDQRGCGRSELGDPAEFSQEALVQDIHELVLAEPVNNNINGDDADSRKLLLLGHSLGGRIALAYAAAHPENVAALVIEDMDIQVRLPETAPFEVTTDSFDRQSKTLETATTNLKKAGYPDSRIERWVEEGRIEQQGDGSWWSHVNPLFRKLCYQHVLGTAKGQRDCQSIANIDDKSMSFPVHLMVAGSEGTVCNEESVQQMKAILGDQLKIHRYPEAGHSIHSSATEEFLKTMESIIADVSS